MTRKLVWISILLILASLYTVTHYQLKNRVILQSFMDLEHEESQKNLSRAMDAIKREIHHLNKLAGDWAIWDDTYRFARDGNKDFISSNLQLETLDIESGISLVFILTPQGKRVWGSAYNSEKGGSLTLDEFADESLDMIADLLKHDTPHSSKTGILITDYGPLLLASRPILTSTGQGPSAGILILGRFLSDRILKTLVDQTKVDFTVKGILTGRMTDHEKDIIARLARTPWIIEADSDDHMNAFGLFPDIYGRPGLLVHASIQRTIMEKGRTAARYVSGSLMISLAFGTLFLVFMVKIYTIDERKRTARVEALVEQRTMELKHANMETDKARIAAVEASKAKSEFLANMSHEIRTPLNGVIGMTEIAMPTIQNDTQREIFETISREAHALLGIINNILDFSKIEARKVEIENIPFDLHLLVADIGKSQMFLCERQGLICIVDLSPEVPRDVKGDPGRIRQILMNLCGNALKFTREGGIVIRCEMTEDSDQSCTIKFSVTDTGIGIEKEKQDKIFESFTQVDGSTTRKYGGTGLGITISKQLAELMGGDMGVQSEFGQGSTFWFTVRMSRQNKPLSRSASRKIESLSILAVGGDEREPLPYIKNLAAMGFACESALSGKDALTLLKQPDAADGFNLIIIDYLLSDTDGFTLATDIKAMENACRLPIILTTSVGNIGDGRRCEDIGIRGYLSAPIAPGLLKKAIRLVMASGGAIRPRKKKAWSPGIPLQKPSMTKAGSFWWKITPPTGRLLSPFWAWRGLRWMWRKTEKRRWTNS
jgi:signal transduction histidine kinase